MDSIKHFILTRYNVATPGRWEEIRLRPHWLEKRFQLFRDYCLPGVAGQTRKDFEWIIFFDEQTPADYMDRIRALQVHFPFRIITTPLFEMSALAPQILAERAEAEWLLTTRLDTDDILATDFVERLRRDLKPGMKQVFNFPHGLMLSLKDGKAPALYRDRDDSSPFVSLFEPFDENLTTIWKEMHRYADRLAPLVQAGPEPAWLQIVHGDNIANRIRGVRVAMQDYVGTFPYLNTLPEAATEKRQEIAFENRFVTPFRLAKEEARNLVKKIIGRR